MFLHEEKSDARRASHELTDPRLRKPRNYGLLLISQSIAARLLPAWLLLAYCLPMD